MKPGITVIIPVRNRKQLISRSLDSVFNQTCRPLRLIVVDNGSTDGTAETVAAWCAAHEEPGFRASLLHEPAPGASPARNRGLDACDTEWVMFFDSDDELLPDAVETAVETASRNPEAELIFWRAAVAGADGKPVPKHFHTRNLMRNQLLHSILSTQCFAVKTAFIRKAGGWNNSLPVWNDWELGLRLLSHSPKTAHTSAILALIHPQKDSITGTRFHDKKGEWELSLRSMAAYAMTLPPAMGGKVLPLLLYRSVILAAHYGREGCQAEAADLLCKTLSGCFPAPEAPANASLPFWKKVLLKGIYRYTKAGGKGAYLLWH